MPAATLPALSYAVAHAIMRFASMDIRQSPSALTLGLATSDGPSSVAQTGWCSCAHLGLGQTAA